MLTLHSQVTLGVFECSLQGKKGKACLLLINLLLLGTGSIPLVLLSLEGMPAPHPLHKVLRVIEWPHLEDVLKYLVEWVNSDILVSAGGLVYVLGTLPGCKQKEVRPPLYLGLNFSWKNWHAARAHMTNFL